MKRVLTIAAILVAFGAGTANAETIFAMNCRFSDSSQLQLNGSFGGGIRVITSPGTLHFNSSRLTPAQVLEKLNGDFQVLPTTNQWTIVNRGRGYISGISLVFQRPVNAPLEDSIDELISRVLMHANRQVTLLVSEAVVTNNEDVQIAPPLNGERLTGSCTFSANNQLPPESGE